MKTAIKIRRLENNLTTLGTGVIVFSLWSFIKSLLSSLLIEEYDFSKNKPEYALIVNTIIWSVSALIVLMYVWIGLSARAEGKGKHKRIIYLFFEGIVILFGSLILLTELLALITLSSDPVTLVLTIIIDATRLFFMIQLMYSSIALRKLKRQLREKEASGA